MENGKKKKKKKRGLTLLNNAVNLTAIPTQGKKDEKYN